MKNFGTILATTAIIAFATVNAADPVAEQTKEIVKEPDFFDTL